MSAPFAHVLPHLEVVALERVVLHEEFDARRIEALAERVQRDGVVRNPPIVAPLGDGRYVVLDGANRVSALKYLEYRDALVQIVDYHDVQLHTWHHLVTGFAGDDLFAEIRERLAMPPEPSDLAAARRALGAGALAFLGLPDGRTYVLPGGGDLVARAAGQCALVGVYNGRADIHRVQADDLSALAGAYDDPRGLVVFPTYAPDDVLALVRAGGRLPSGISRHVIPGRALRVNYALALLADPRDRGEKNAELAQWIRRKLQAREIRYYDEPTVLYDE